MALRFISLALAFALVATVTFASGDSDDDSAAAAEKEYVTDPSTGKQVLKPQYGGTITYALETPLTHTDTYIWHGAQVAVSGVVEGLAIHDWAIDRDVYDLTSDQNAPWLFRGHLAESWETPDDTTIVFNIRQGVHYHDKEPVNGRELTAQDVEYNFHRLLGLGSGFTEPSPQTWGVLTLPIESVTATDKWTVEIKLSQPDLRALGFLLGDCHGIVYPPEIIEEHGNAEDWRTIVGTGPWMLTDWVEAASLTWVKNPNYWKDDEKFPGHHTPFEEWPAELKGYYTYDLEGAGKLLDEAGYPRGADGIRFTAELLHRDAYDLGYTEIAVGYWADIGVEVTTSVIDTGTWVATKADTTYEISGGDMAQPNAVWAMQVHRDSNPFIREYLACSDPCAIDTSVMDAASDAFYAAATLEEQAEAAQAYNMFAIEQHMQIWGPLAPQFQANNPWVKGYNGEFSLGDLTYHPILARLWIDQDLKREMGF